MNSLLRYTHALLRRNWDALERLLTAAALAGLLLYLMRSLPAYPPNWDLALAGLVFGAALGSTPLGYFLGVAAAVYPLFHTSIYLLALFLAVALLGQRLFINHLGGTLLGLAAPLFSRVYLPFAVPVLGGLWWGPGGGALIGALAAAWGLLLAGMSGGNPDWLARLGTLPDTAAVAQRFAGADSLDTLWKLAEPFAADSSTALLYLLQVVLWGAVGWAVGRLSEKPWLQRRRIRAGLLLGLLGAGTLLLGHALLGLWLGLYGEAGLYAGWQLMLKAFAFTTLAAAAGEMLLDMVEYPLGLPAARRSSLFRRRPETPLAAERRWSINPPADAPAAAAHPPVRRPPEARQADERRLGDDLAEAEPGSARRADPAADEPDDLIKLELD
ncbi:MAG: hypothetical protein ACKOC5_16965 [Chloroflexota bacterium]